MTSKESIERIKDDFEIKYDNLKNEIDRQNIIGLCEVIEKDLEVLSLIKKIFIYDEYNGFDIDFRKVKPMERDKIKEWLLERKN